MYDIEKNYFNIYVAEEFKLSNIICHCQKVKIVLNQASLSNGLVHLKVIPLCSTLLLSLKNNLQIRKQDKKAK